MHIHKTSSCVVALVALILCGAAEPACASSGEPADPPIFRVQTQDLRLEFPADQKRLDRRIASAARTVCRDWQDLPDFIGYGRCLDQARRSARAQRNQLVERAVQRDMELAQARFFIPDRELTAAYSRNPADEDAAR